MILLAITTLTLIACDRGDDGPPDASRPDAARVDSGPTPDGGPDCEGENGCYDCEPETVEQRLNTCTDATCEPFDNEDRLGRYTGPTLPPLP